MHVALHPALTGASTWRVGAMPWERMRTVANHREYIDVLTPAHQVFSGNIDGAPYCLIMHVSDALILLQVLGTEMMNGFDDAFMCVLF